MIALHYNELHFKSINTLPGFWIEYGPVPYTKTDCVLCIMCYVGWLKEVKTKMTQTQMLFPPSICDMSRNHKKETKCSSGQRTDQNYLKIKITLMMQLECLSFLEDKQACKWQDSWVERAIIQSQKAQVSMNLYIWTSADLWTVSSNFV